MGGNGAVYNNKHYKTKPVEVFDVCGAGDVFLASMVKQYLETKSMEESIIFANKCASMSVTKMGTYVLCREDIDEICI